MIIDRIFAHRHPSIDAIAFSSKVFFFETRATVKKIKT
jgi:hypothetical protein